MNSTLCAGVLGRAFRTLFPKTPKVSRLKYLGLALLVSAGSVFAQCPAGSLTQTVTASTAALAATIDQSTAASVTSPPKTNWPAGTTLSVAKFNSALGTLCSVDYTVNGTAQGTGQTWITGGSTPTPAVTLTIAATITITGASVPAATLQVIPTTSQTFTGLPVISIASRNSTNGATLVATTPQQSSTITLTDATSLAALSGSGNLTFNATAVASSGSAGSGNAANLFFTQATGGVSIAYHYVVADLSISKTHAGSVWPGKTGLTYTIAVTNNGPSSTLGTVSVADTLPASLTATSISGTGWTCTGNAFPCTRTDTLASGSSYPNISVVADISPAATGSISNTATVTGNGDPNTTNNSSTDTVALQFPDLTISKSHTGSFTQGQVGATYSVTVTNSGPVPTNGTQVSVTDTPPTGITITAAAGTGWTCNPATFVCTRTDVLANGASYPAITYTVTVAGNASTPLVNTAVVSGGGETNTSNDTATDSTVINVAAVPDLTISKSHTGSVWPGKTGLTYTLAVSNAGTATTAGVVSVADTLPASLTLTSVSGTGWTCTGNTFPCTRSDALAAGSSYPNITVVADVSASATGTISNTATVSGGGETNTSNDSSTDPATVQFPDLTISKSHTGDFAQGQVGATYTVTVTNSGPVPTNGTQVSVTDTPPAGITITAAAGTGWTCNPATFVCTRTDVLANGASYPAITYTVTVAGNAATPLVNTAVVSGGGEANTSNDTATDSTVINVGAVPDLTILKSHSGSVWPGKTGLTYTLTVSNAGAATTAGVVSVADTLPASLTLTSVSGTGWTCAGNTFPCTRSDALAAGSSYADITVVADVSAAATGTISNTATVSGGGETNTSNDSSTDPATVQFPDLTISKSHTGNFAQGQVGATYTVTVTNSGLVPTNGTQVSVTDTPPAGITITAAAGTGWTCNPATFVCTRTDVLANGASYPAITYTVTVAGNAATPLTNTAVVSGGGETNTSNDTATDSTIITAVVPDLTISKSHTGSIWPGQTGLNYTITVSNAGATATTGAVSVADTLPASLTATSISGPGWTCTGGTFPCTRSDALAAGSSYPAITVVANVSAAATGTISNTATVSGGGETNTSNDSAIDTATLQVPDLTISKSHTGSFAQGQVAATYAVTVTNSGPVPTNGTQVSVTDTPPAGITITAAAGTGWTCNPATFVCTRTDVLVNAASYPAITYTVTVAANAATPLVNTAVVSGGGETNTSNDTATDSTVITAVPADLTITKSHTGAVWPGQTGLSYTVTVTNSGAGPTAGTVQVVDTLPAALTLTTISGTGWTCTAGTLTCTRTDVLVAGASYPVITVTANVSPAATGNITNTAVVSGGGETNTSNDTATDTVALQVPDLTISKSHAGSFTQGQTGATYTVTVTNSGPVPTNGTQVSVTDTPPAGVTIAAAAGTGWTCNPGTFVCTRTDVLANAASYPAITYTVNVAGSASTPLVNTAVVSGGGETNTSNDTATDSTVVTPIPDLTITKSHTGSFVQGQVGATYTIGSSNVGGAATTGLVTVQDTLPAGMTATAIAGTGWSCTLGTLTCTRSDALGAAASYPNITVTVNISNSAGTPLTNTAVISGGGETNTTNDTASDLTAVGPTPDMTISKSHTGNFTQGQVGATYTISVSNIGGSTSTGLVTVTDTLPTGLTATAMTGAGWSCTVGTLTCTRSDGLAVSASYPAITVTVNVAQNSPFSLTNTAVVSGGGEANTSNDTATDPTTVNGVPDVTIQKSHSGGFTQGQPGAYTLLVSNVGTAATTGAVTVTDSLPGGMSAVSMSGAGWTCSVGTVSCSRSDALAVGASYPAIAVGVSVATNASGTLTNTATVGGGGETNLTNDSASDPTAISGVPDLTISKTHSGVFTQGQSGSFTLTVSNVGVAGSAGPVNVSDSLPGGLTATGISGSGWICNLSQMSCLRTDTVAAGGELPPDYGDGGYRGDSNRNADERRIGFGRRRSEYHERFGQ